MTRRTGIAFALSIALGLAAAPASARYKSKHLDGVVASVDSRPILISEVRLRAKPSVAANAKLPPKEQAPEEQIYKEQLEQLIEERLILADADRLRLTSSPEEVEAAVKLIAKENKLTVEQIYDAAREEGMLQYDYRELLKKQIIAAKWVRARVKPGSTQQELLVELAKTFTVERDLL